MILPYNSTVYANASGMKPDFVFSMEKEEKMYRHIKDKKIVFKDEDFYTLAKIINICLFNDFPKVENLLNYFKNIAKISNKLEIYIPWSLPTGLNVKQNYYANKTIKLKLFIYTKDLLNLNILDKNKTNTRKQIRALMPNLVHSLDAASLALLIENFFKEDKTKNFFSVHDCFAVTAIV